MKRKSIIPRLEYLDQNKILELLNKKEITSKYAGYNLSNIDEENRWGLKERLAGIGLKLGDF